MEDLIYYSGGQPVGVVAPSVFYSFEGDEVLINGPDGMVSACRRDSAGFRSALLASGALVEGTTDEVAEVIRLLENPESSRTVSYLLCSARRCSQVIDDSKAFRSARVAIVGCGGIGSSLCMLLAGAGIRNFLLIDADVIEKSNLNRQLFWTLADVGRKKVEVLKSALEARFEDVQVAYLDAEVGVDELLVLTRGDVEAVAISADSPSTFAREGWRVAENCQVPVASGGYLHHICTSFSFIPGDCAEIERASESLEGEQCFTLPSAVMPSYGPMNFSLAAVLATNLLMSLASSTFGKQRTRVDRWDSRGVGDHAAI